MIFFIEAILMGIVATLVMDLGAILFARTGVIHPQIGPGDIGRWTLYMLRGKFVHEDIRKTAPLSNEKQAGFLAHYLIGVALAGVYLIIELLAPAVQDRVWVPLLFGISTSVLPWFWLFPSMGVGFLASKAPKKSHYLVTSLVNHTSFGLGFVLWIVLFRPLLT